MALYKRLYTVIGVVILLLGVSLTPFLSVFIEDMPQDIPALRLYYVMFVADSAASYFFTYKRSLLFCDQKEYISTVQSFVFSILTTLVRLVVLIRTHDFFWYLLVTIVGTLLGNIAISVIAGRVYPFLKDTHIQPLAVEERKSIRDNTRAMIFHRVGDVLVFSTDNLIISRFVGLVGVGLYSNYTLLIRSVNGLIGRLFASATASVGSLIASGERERCREVLDHVVVFSVWLYGFTGICLFCLAGPFIKLWAGESYLLPQVTLAAAVVSFYLTGLRQPVLLFKETAGIFRQDRYKALIEAAVNIVLSIPLAIRFGITGVILGTILSTLLVCFWFEVYVVFHNLFDGGTRRYLMRQALYGVMNASLCTVTFALCQLVKDEGLAGFLLKMGVCILFPNLVYYLAFGRTAHFRYFVGVAHRVLKR